MYMLEFRSILLQFRSILLQFRLIHVKNKIYKLLIKQVSFLGLLGQQSSTLFEKVKHWATRFGSSSTHQSYRDRLLTNIVRIQHPSFSYHVNPALEWTKFTYQWWWEQRRGLRQCWLGDSGCWKCLSQTMPTLRWPWYLALWAVN